jgi:outer membrane receptor protein involved in Fe transport
MRKVLLMLILLFTVNISNAQRIIKGKVTDSLTNEPFQLAVVRVPNTSTTQITDKNGDFILRNVMCDSLQITYMGFSTKKVKAIYGKPMLIKLVKGQITLKDIRITNSPTLSTYKILSSLDLNMQPVKSAQDLLRMVPGLFIAQHQGGGKAEQIFLRGFDADHGTDVNISVDGIPVNMVTHAHGQGYADLHFLIPETVESYDFGKGPYYSDKSDFTTAGYVAYTTKTSIAQNMIKVEAGQFNTYRTVALIDLLNKKAKEKGQNAYVAAEGLYSNGGPFTLGEHFTRFNFFGKFNTKIASNSRLTAIISTLKSDWRASGEIPDRAVSEGYISSRFGAIDSSQGGHTVRTNVSLKLVTDLGNNWTMDNQLWYSHYFFNLVSNFTFYYYFPITGDEFRQLERRNLGGYSGKISKSTSKNNTTFTTTAGLNTRNDRISPIELDHTENGRFLDYLQYGRARELNINGYLEELVCTGKWLFNVGIRMDYFHFYYQNMVPLTDTIASSLFNKVTPHARKSIISPAVNTQYTFNDKLQLYFKAGKGFHSNDARVVIANQGFEDLPAAYGMDLGLNWKPFPRLFINNTLWYLYLEQEYTFGQDLIDQPAGPVSPSGKTVRIGIDFSARYQFTTWLFAKLNINIARPRYLDSLKGHDYVALAPTLTSTAGLDFRLKNGINGGISYRYLHNRPADTEDLLTARGYFISDFAINYTQKKYEFGVTIENVFNRRWDESQFEYLSQLKGEAAPLDQISYTPGVPFFAKLKVTVFF